MEKTEKERMLGILGAVGLGLFMFKGKLFGVTITPPNDLEEKIKELREYYDKKAKEIEAQRKKEIQQIEAELDRQKAEIDKLTKEKIELEKQLAEKQSIDIEAKIKEIEAQIYEKAKQQADALAELRKKQLEIIEAQVKAETAKILTAYEAENQSRENQRKLEQDKLISQALANTKQAEAEATKELQRILEMKSTITREKELWEKASQLRQQYMQQTTEAMNAMQQAEAKARELLAEQQKAYTDAKVKIEAEARKKALEVQAQITDQLHKQALEYANQLAEQARKARLEQAEVLRKYGEELAKQQQEYASKLFQMEREARAKADELEATIRQQQIELSKKYAEELAKKAEEASRQMIEEMKRAKEEQQRKLENYTIQAYNELCNIIKDNIFMESGLLKFVDEAKGQQTAFAWMDKWGYLVPIFSPSAGGLVSAKKWIDIQLMRRLGKEVVYEIPKVYELIIGKLPTISGGLMRNEIRDAFPKNLLCFTKKYPWRESKVPSVSYNVIYLLTTLSVPPFPSTVNVVIRIITTNIDKILKVLQPIAEKYRKTIEVKQK